MSGLRSRNKGKRGEREVAEAFRAIYGDKVRRGWQTREGDDDPDVVGTPFWPEVKRQKCCNIKAAIRQATEESDGRPVVAITKDDHGEWLATMRFEDWCKLLRVAEHQNGTVDAA